MSEQQHELSDAATRAVASIDVDRLRRLTGALVDIPSPTGRELASLQYLRDVLLACDVAARVDPVGPQSGLLLGEIAGTGDGPSMLLYSHIDTHLPPEEDSSKNLAGLRRDMIARAEHEENFVIGLGAANPKASVAIVTEALLAIRASGIKLRGDLLLGVAGGGMPVRLDSECVSGLGDGAYRLLTRGGCADFAIVVKPGQGVYYEEAGLCWLRVRVHGALGYAGLPKQANDNPITAIPHLVTAIENWLLHYAKHESYGQVAARGTVTALQAGAPDRLAFTPDIADIFIDLRCPPRLSPAVTKALFAAAMSDIAERLGLRLSIDMLGSYPGATTPADSLIIQSAIRAWEAVEGRPHVAPSPASGQTDISLLRNMHIPTARIGWPTTPDPRPDDLKGGGIGGMGCAHVPDMHRACQKVVRTIVETCGRTRQQAGLDR